MNFVIFTANFLPQSDAESFCTTRFASALATQGHIVHVVTLDWPQQVSPKTCSFLIHPNVRISRICQSVHRCSNFHRFQYLTTEWESRDYGRMIATLKSVLNSYDKPILVSRSCPETSHIVAWHCRKHAYRWIAHFSDPMPMRAKGGDLKNRLWRYLSYRWMRKTIQDCDGVSLTCDVAARFYSETYGRIFDGKHLHVTFHVGEPMLPLPLEEWRNPFNEKIVTHAGMLYGNRGEREMAEALDSLNSDGVKVRFIQVGSSCGHAGHLKGRNDVSIVETLSPDFTTAVLEKSDVSFIADVRSDFAYTPYMPSKFVYQLFSRKPLVLLTRKGSPMFNIYQAHKDAGLFLADYESPGSLAVAIKQALNAPMSFQNRISACNCFTRKSVADGFARFVQELI